MLIRNGIVYLEDGPRRADVLVEGGTVAAVGRLEDRAAHGEVFDASGLSVLPGMIDLHVHVDDEINGIPLADTFLTASHAAVVTGVTTLVAFVTQKPGRTLPETVVEYLARGSRGSHCDFHFHLTPTDWAGAVWSDLYALAEKGFCTVKLYTTYREAGLYTGYDRLGEVMERCAGRGLRVLLHCEDQAALDGARQGAVKPGALHGTGQEAPDPALPRSHALLRPEAAEVLSIRKAVEKALETGALLHVVHVSSAEGAMLLQSAREPLEDPMGITFETGPQYLLLNDEKLEGDSGHRYLCTPPLRREANRARMASLAAKGVFPVFATDHCAFTRGWKDRFAGDAERVPMGLPGVGALVPLLHERLVKGHGLDLSELVLRLSKHPAQVAGFYPRKGAIRPGSDADLVMLDPNGPERRVTSSLADTYEPYSGFTTTLDVRRVLLRGRTVVIDNALADPDHPDGRSVCNL